MKRLSHKILFALMMIFFIISVIGRLMVFTFDLWPNPSLMEPQLVFLFIIFIGFISLTLFGLAVNYVILKRIQKMDHAVKKIETGHYDFQLEVEGKDEISALMRNINNMTKELQSNEYLSKEFAKNVSHEFKTPLSSIKGYAELIESGSLTQEEVIEYSGIIIHEINRLAQLSKNMLQISLLDSVNVIKQDETYSIDEQIRNVLQVLQIDWESKDIEFELDLDEVTAIGNKELTFQIWQNLIANSIKFSHPSGLVRISLRQNQDIEFQIQDHGIGISTEDQAKVFNQFFISDKSRNKSGSGLGLSITKKIVEKLGGAIEFTSVLGEGTTFTVKLTNIAKKEN